MADYRDQASDGDLEYLAAAPSEDLYADPSHMAGVYTQDIGRASTLNRLRLLWRRTAWLPDAEKRVTRTYIRVRRDMLEGS